MVADLITTTEFHRGRKMPTNIMTQWTHLRKCRSVNQTSTSFVSKVPLATDPVDDTSTATGQATIDMRNGATLTQNALIILPYATASDNQTFSVRVIGWRRLGDSQASYIWIPVLLCEVLCTADSTLVGLAGRLIVATEIFCDTITIVGTSGNANVSCELVSPADGVSVAHLVVDTKGFDKTELSFSTGSSATDCNALVASL